MQSLGKLQHTSHNCHYLNKFHSWQSNLLLSNIPNKKNKIPKCSQYHIQSKMHLAQDTHNYQECKLIAIVKIQFDKWSKDNPSNIILICMQSKNLFLCNLTNKKNILLLPSKYHIVKSNQNSNNNLDNFSRKPLYNQHHKKRNKHLNWVENSLKEYKLIEAI